MYHLKKNGLLAVGAFLLGILLAVLLGTPSADSLTTPLANFGQWLRAMSLRSSTGNLGAWAIVLSLSGLPALGLLWKKRCKEDLLLLLGGAELFVMLFGLVNPTIVSQTLGWLDGDTIAKIWALTAGGCMVSTLICWLLLRILRILARKPAEILPMVLIWSAVGYAFLLGFSGIQSIGRAMENLAAGNTREELLTASWVMVTMRQILAWIPDLLGVWALLLAGRLALALEQAPFAGETIVLAEQISGRTQGIAKASLLLTVLGNVLQLLWFPKLLQIHMELHVPLLTLLFCAVLILLCQYFRRAKEISDDNASII